MTITQRLLIAAGSAAVCIVLIFLIIRSLRAIELARQAGLRFEAEEAARRIREHIRATTRQALHEALAADDSPKIWPPNDPPVWPEIEATRKDEG